MRSTCKYLWERILWCVTPSKFNFRLFMPSSANLQSFCLYMYIVLRRIMHLPFIKGTPPVYEDCRCENNECFSVVFKANNGSSTGSMNDEVVVITSGNGVTDKVSTLETSGSLVDAIGAQVAFNGEVGYFYKNGDCTAATSPQCEVASGPLCSNELCATTTGSCSTQGDGCLDLMGEAEDCESPANVCGSGYCGA